MSSNHDSEYHNRHFKAKTKGHQTYNYLINLNCEMEADEQTINNLANKVQVGGKNKNSQGYRDENERLFYENKRLRVENEENL